MDWTAPRERNRRLDRQRRVLTCLMNTDGRDYTEVRGYEGAGFRRFGVIFGVGLDVEIRAQ